MTDWAARINQIRGAGFTLKAVAKHTGINVPTLYKLSNGATVKSTPENWEKLDLFYKSLTQAGVIK